jgi:hypothetical protein
MNDRPGDRGEPGTDEDDDEGHRDAASVTVRLSPAGRAPVVLAGVIAIFVFLALVKPWGFVGGSPPRPAIRTTPAPTVQASADPLGALRHHCQEPLGWRVYSRERWATTTVRSWRSLEPVSAATGPLDSHIPVVPIGAPVDAVGYCSPWSGAERPPEDARVDGWRIALIDGGDPGLSFAETIRLQRDDPGWPSVLGALYGPPVNRFDPKITDRVGWPGGRFVFAVRAHGYERWWAVDIEPPAVVRPTGGPAASPSP